MLLCQALDLAGGVERFACGLANHLAAQGFDTALGSVATARGAVAYPLDPRVRVLTGSPAPATPAPLGRGVAALRRWALLRNQWRTGRALARLIRAERPDVVVLNGLTTACSALLFCPGCARRAICCDHNHFDARSRPWRWLRARLYPKVAALVSLTETDAPKFRALNRRTEVIANASAVRSPEPPAEPDPSAGAAAERPPLVLAIGRCVAQKGFDLLLQAWEQVSATQAATPARLRIIGDGSLRESLIEDARRLGLGGSVEWLLPTADITRHYREAALFVLPSRYEGLPLVLLEAQAMGLPAVAFDCPTGPAEIVTAGTGIVVPAEDVTALAGALRALLAEPALRRRMGRAAWARSRDHFSPEAHFRRWTALVTAVAGQGAGSAGGGRGA